MQKNRLILPAFAVMVAVQLGISFAHGQKAGASPSPLPNPVNVKVINTTSEPIPVTGSITASGGVSITNTPTVKIDETANTVVVRNSAEQALFVVFTMDQNRTFGVTTTKYSKVRVCVDQTSWFSRNVTIRSNASGTGFDDVPFIIDSLALHGDLENVNDHRCGVYEVPGKHMIIEVPGTDTSQPGTMRLVVFGYPN